MIDFAASTARHKASRHILRLAWMGVLLGLALELTILALQSSSGRLPGHACVAADFLHKIIWSSLICAALAAGQSIAKLNNIAMGLAGFVFGPWAFLIATSVHNGVLSALDIELAINAVSPWTLAKMRGLEFATLGFALSWLKKSGSGWAWHMAIGAAIGMATSFALWCVHPVVGLELLPCLINEILHPSGCALALYLGGGLLARLRQTDDNDTGERVDVAPVVSIDRSVPIAAMRQERVPPPYIRAYPMCVESRPRAADEDEA